MYLSIIISMFLELSKKKLQYNGLYPLDMKGNNYLIQSYQLFCSCIPIVTGYQENTHMNPLTQAQNLNARKERSPWLVQHFQVETRLPSQMLEKERSRSSKKDLLGKGGYSIKSHREAVYPPSLRSKRRYADTGLAPWRGESLQTKRRRSLRSTGDLPQEW